MAKRHGVSQETNGRHSRPATLQGYRGAYRHVPLPFAAWRALAWTAELLLNPPVTRNQVELMQVDNVCSPGVPGFAELGISPHSVESMLEQTLRSRYLTEGGLVVSPNENNRRIEAFRRMLGTAPKPGTNTILITHKPNIVDALGKDWFDVKEGEASLFRPENGSYKLLARVQMDEWPRIAAAAAK
jgi:hypothetical protein